MQKPPEVEQQKGDDEIKKDEYGGVAHLVTCRSQIEGKAVDGTRKVKKQGEKCRQTNAHHGPAPARRQRQETPHMPQNIGKADERQHEEKNKPHCFHCFKYGCKVTSFAALTARQPHEKRDNGNIFGKTCTTDRQKKHARRFLSGRKSKQYYLPVN